ncbi:GL15339 [Drosophila persimilis]|uniref:GL15339 n=1 Tax=Drosophila persimilis TaxID=7234 RepID=B4IRB4_DROPE|nr:GL15339 [Drosophila persimilis]
MVSPTLLAGTDIREQHFANISLVELLEVSNVTAFQDADLLRFLIRFPQPKLICKKLLICSGPTREQNLGLQRRRSSSRMRKSSTQHRELRTQRRRNVLQGATGYHLRATTSSGIHRTLRHATRTSGPDNRSRPRHDHHKRRQRDRHRRRGGATHDIAGTYLISYSSRVALNGSWYFNHLGDSKRKAVVSAMSRVNVTDHRERLSLPFLRELSLKNLDHIGDLRDLLTVKSMSSYILTVVTVIPLCVVIGILYRRLDARAPKQNADAAQSTENGRQPPIAPYRAPQVTTTSAKPGARLYQLPPSTKKLTNTVLRLQTTVNEV